MTEEESEEIRAEQETAISVLGEDEEGVVTYSYTMPVAICGYHKKDNLVIPYSVIKHFKTARLAGAREAYFMASARPDRLPSVRSLLDLWGFESYIDYLNTLCELSFLEGLIPVLEVGFLSPKELKKIQEIAALNKIMINPYSTSGKKVAPADYAKEVEVNLKSLEWCGRLKFPVIAGLYVGVGETKTQRQQLLQEIVKAHATYGMIHEVHLQNFPIQKGGESQLSASSDALFQAYEQAKEILPADIPVTIPIEFNKAHLELFIKAGMTDLGRVFAGRGPYMSSSHAIPSEEIPALLPDTGLQLQQRFALRKAFIKNECYSKKLGQVFDTYRYKIKKDGMDKIKTVKKANGS